MNAVQSGEELSLSEYNLLEIATDPKTTIFFGFATKKSRKGHFVKEQTIP